MVNSEDNQKTSDAPLELSPAPAEKAVRKPLVQSAKVFFSGALSSVKGKDMNQLIEDFTSEMTLVAEGLSEDQARLSKAQENLSAQQTVSEEALRAGMRECSEALKQENERMDKLEKQFAQLQKQVADKKIKKIDGLTGLLRQATWLAAIAAGAWIVVTILRFFQ